MTYDLVAQVGAVLGTSILLYVVTAPSNGENFDQRDPTVLRGATRYSSYHRKRSMSMPSRVAQEEEWGGR
eukprot:CAMPEP_0118716190 /NCGR_PEP_ID=MMETSP0800-20121206/27348_1 /TAXON_ID=210618 ORGANISM="Striatella unipunctata, Strain CCMP2910" /NCGR_SAMPLE_ID=MMETSP0800 /ASSEMBLY_ACC=CAM_ASM_000638 /LENGTH=69 /DNA_ID=CAMNT_0006622553 /DNA_START=163 /DNA_END=372 /DNA_ORIENTATION=+